MKKSNKLPEVKILKIVEHKDGTASYTFEYDTNLVRIVREKCNLDKNPTKKQIQQFILKALKNSTEYYKKYGST